MQMLREALDGVLFDGMFIAAGGLGLCGIPENLIQAIVDNGTKDLTIASNNAGVDDWPWPAAADQAGEEDDLVLCGRECRVHAPVSVRRTGAGIQPAGHTGRADAAGGCGIPGFYTKTGVGTVIAEGKEEKVFDGETYILERGMIADLSIVKAWKADETGNLVFRKAARNFNPPAAMCGKICVVEVEEIVPTGSLDPDNIHLPGIYVHRLVQGEHEKRIEQHTTRAA